MIKHLWQNNIYYQRNTDNQIKIKQNHPVKTNQINCFTAQICDVKKKMNIQLVSNHSKITILNNSLNTQLFLSALIAILGYAIIFLLYSYSTTK